MNKQDLLSDLNDRDFVGELVGEPKFVSNLKGYDATGKEVDTEIAIYEQRYLEVVGKAARPRVINIYVKQGGKAEETAFYVDNEPARSIPIWEVAKPAAEGV